MTHKNLSIKILLCNSTTKKVLSNGFIIVDFEWKIYKYFLLIIKNLLIGQTNKMENINVLFIYVEQCAVNIWFPGSETTLQHLIKMMNFALL